MNLRMGIVGSFDEISMMACSWSSDVSVMDMMLRSEIDSLGSSVAYMSISKSKSVSEREVVTGQTPLPSEKAACRGWS